MPKRALAILALLVAMLVGGRAWADGEPVRALVPPLVVQDGERSWDGRDIAHDLEVLDDKTAALGIDDVKGAHAARFKRPPETSGSPSFGFTTSAIWVRITIRDLRSSPGGMREPLVLESGYALTDRIEVYTESAGQHPQPPMQLGGDAVPFAARAIPYRFPAFVIAPSREGTTYYLRVTSSSSIPLPLRLWSSSSFAGHTTRDGLAQGLYVGLIVAVIVYQVLLAFGLRSSTHSRYALFLASFLGFQTTIEGLGFQFLWPTSSWAADHAIPIFCAAAISTSLPFARDYLGLDRAEPRMAAMTRGFAFFTVAYGVASLVLPVRECSRIAAFLVLACSLLILVIASVRLRDASPGASRRPIQLFLIAWSALLFGSMTTALRVQSVIPTNTFTLYAQQIGSLFEAVLLSLGLAARVDMLRRKADTERARALEATTRSAAELEKLNEELRRQIAERSRSLAEALAGITGAQDASSQNALLHGAVLDGRYRIVKTLGAGGMGAVLEVERVADGRKLALKVLSGTPTAAAAARFAREAEIAAKVHHKNLVSIVDVGVSDAAGGNRLYLVMELVEGSALEASRSRFGDVAWALPLLAELAEGLAALHTAGIVHRDLKPGNILLPTSPAGLPGGDGARVKIADFGIARLSADRDAEQDVQHTGEQLTTLRSARPSELTQTGLWLGTPQYMAPELAMGVQNARPAVDVFAFGVVAHELLTGSSPFETPPIYDALAGRSIHALYMLYEIELPSRADDPVARVVERCIQVDPSARPTAREICDAFAHHRGRKPASASVVTLAPGGQ